jgi:Zn finger protein HypA/HybF involved in hydrogenase expression
MKFEQEVDECWIIPIDRFNNPAYIEERIKNVTNKTLFKNILEYLYYDDCTLGFNNKKLNYICNLEQAEQILVNQLRKYTDGGKKDNGGYKALIQARKVRYRCEKCGYPDVRVMEVDHVTGKKDPNTEYAYLCSNCHRVKHTL